MTPDPDAQLAARTAEIAAKLKADKGSYAHTMATAHAPITVACPFCKSGRGAECRSTGDYTVAFHAARKRAIAHLSSEQRLEAFAAFRAEREQRRAEAKASAEAFYADPVKVAALHAGWAAQREAWAAVNAEIRAEERDRRERCRSPYLHRDDCQCRDPQWTPPPLRTPRPVGVADVADLDAERARRAR